MTSVTLNQLEKKASLAESLIASLTKQIEGIEAAKLNEKKSSLKIENEQLKEEVNRLVKQLVELEKQKGIQQHYDFSNCVNNFLSSTTAIQSSETKPEEKKSSPPPQSSAKQEKKPKKEKAPKKDEKKVEEAPIDVGRLDFRVGEIISAEKHPDADSLYVEQINCGEDSPRTVVSGLVKFIPLEEMQKRKVVVLCNLKPVKMRGVTSHAMVMCASTPEKVEILSPPENSQPGDLVEFEGFPRLPDAQLNPKKKIFETCAPDLKTNSDLIAVYRDVPMTVPGKGVVKSQTLGGVMVK